MLATRARMAAGAGGGDTIDGTLVGPTTITTSTSSTATAYSNQRKIDRCQNGVLWVIYSTIVTGNYRYHLAHSTDDGATWSVGDSGFHAGSAVSFPPNASLFIDLDDYAHVAYKDPTDGYIYYRRGTPNAGRTAWTWSSAVSVAASTYADYPDVVAFRNPATGGWDAVILFSWENGGNNTPVYVRQPITSGGSFGAQSRDGLTSIGVGSGGYFSFGGATVDTFPSVDFNHTGDGKTVAGGTPHLYVAWSAGATGAGKGIRFKKATYSGGTWTWGTEREIDNARYVTADGWVNCLFDGTRVIIVGEVYNGSTSDLILHDRDAADTTTTTRALLTARSSIADNLLLYGSASYDGDGNAYIFGRNADEGTGTWDLVYRKWTRVGTSLGSEAVIDAGTGNTPYITAKRGYSSGRIEFIYTDGTGSPYNVNYGAID